MIPLGIFLIAASINGLYWAKAIPRRFPRLEVIVESQRAFVFLLGAAGVLFLVTGIAQALW